MKTNASQKNKKHASWQIIAIILSIAMFCVSGIMLMANNLQNSYDFNFSQDNVNQDTNNVSLDESVPHEHSGWTSLISPTVVGTVLSAGNYIVDTDLQFSTFSYKINGAVNLCLNGKKISAAAVTKVFSVGTNNSLNICDSESGSIEAKSDTIYLDGGSFSISGGAILTASGVSINNTGEGTIEISGEKTIISTTNNTGKGTIHLNTNSSQNLLNISGGTIESKNTKPAIYCDTYYYGTISITGGTVQNTSSGIAISSQNAGIAISETQNTNKTLITSACGDGNGTIVQSSGLGITVTGGMVTNTGVGKGYAIYNINKGAINISGGTVQSNLGSAICNGNIGLIAISEGKVTSASKDPYFAIVGTICLADGTIGAEILKITGGTVENTSNGSGHAIYNNGKGAVNISNATVTSTLGSAIHNNKEGAITISNATVTSTSGTAIKNASTGSVTISGGTVSATTGNAISNASTGSVTISGGTVSSVEGVAINNSTGKITISAGMVSTTTGNAINTAGGTITILGGTVSATTNDAIFNINTGSVTISGGTVSATSGGAIFNANTGSVTISGGTVSADSGNAIKNASTGSVTISGGTVSSVEGITIFNASTGIITITGETTLITRTSSDNNNDTIYIGKGSYGTEILNISGGNIKNTSNGNAIFNDNVGAITISDGTVSTTTGNAIKNASGTITILGGTVSATTTGNAINNAGNSTITILGGTVSATTTGNAINNANAGTILIEGGMISASSTGNAINNAKAGTILIEGGMISASSTGYAIYNASTGKITISQSKTDIKTLISSSSDLATIYLASASSASSILEITGGTVENVSTGNAIYSASTGIIIISQSKTEIETLITSKNTATGDKAGTIYISNGLVTNVLDIRSGTVTNTANAWAVYNGGNVFSGVLKSTAATVGNIGPVWTITYYKNETNATGDIPQVASVYKGHILSYKVSANPFSLTGHNPNGWNTLSNGTGTAYVDGSKLEGTFSENIALYAQYSIVEYDVTISISPNDSGVIAPDTTTYTVTYNTDITVDGNTIKIGNQVITATSKTHDGYVYTFSNWTINGVAVTASTTITGATTIVANFAQAARNYTISWVLGNETITAQVAYGTLPTEPSDEQKKKTSTAQYDYTFTEFDTEIVNVVGDATYTASYSSSPRKYEVKIENGEDLGIAGGEVAFGGSFSFTLTKKPGFDYDNVVVKVNGIVIESVNGEYKVDNIKSNVVITLEGITEITPETSGLEWWVILLIVVGALGAIALVLIPLYPKIMTLITKRK